MKVIHIANTDVEFEYANLSTLPLIRSWSKHPLCLQLQYLPLLYVPPDVLVAVTDLPDEDYLVRLRQTGWWPEGLPRMILLNEESLLNGWQCSSWGPSRRVQAWAEKRGITYAMPSDWQKICLINSKEFSHRYTTLPEARLLKNEQELVKWIKETAGPKVVKTCYGLSGLGNKRVEGYEITPEVMALCHKEWKNRRPVVGEPWLDRLLDFSTQWKIHADGRVECVGATRFETDPYGRYRGTLAGPERILFAAYEEFLSAHKEFLSKVLEDIVTMGFFGYIGFDALLYRDAKTQKTVLYPLVEINGRQTMSLVALLMQRRICPHHLFQLSYRQMNQASPSLLPDRCRDERSQWIIFDHRLTGQIYIRH